MPSPVLETSMCSPNMPGVDHHFSLPLEVHASGERVGLDGFARLHLCNETFITAVKKNLLCQPPELQSNLMNHGAAAGVSKALGEESGEGGQGPDSPPPARQLRERPPPSSEVG